MLFLLLNIWCSNVQSRTEDKIERFKKAVEYYSVTTKLSSLPVGPSSFLGKASIWYRASVSKGETESLMGTPGPEWNDNLYCTLIEVGPIWWIFSFWFPCNKSGDLRHRALVSQVCGWRPMPFPLLGLLLALTSIMAWCKKNSPVFEFRPEFEFHLCCLIPVWY